MFVLACKQHEFAVAQKMKATHLVHTWSTVPCRVHKAYFCIDFRCYEDSSHLGGEWVMWLSIVGHVVSRPPQGGCNLALWQGWPVRSPLYPSPLRLSSGHWPLYIEEKARAFPRVFLICYNFNIPHLSFTSSRRIISLDSSGLPLGRPRSRKLRPSVIFPREELHRRLLHG